MKLRKAGRREERRGPFNHENVSDLFVFIQLSQKGLGFCDCLIASLVSPSVVQVKVHILNSE